MSSIGNLLGGSIGNLLVQGTLAVATGGTSLAVTTALRGVALSIGDQVLQRLGQEIGLPPAAVDLATAAFHAEAGDIGGAIHSIESASQELGSAAGLGDQDTGQVQNQAYDAVQQLVESINKKMAQGSDGEGGSGVSGGKGQSFLMKLAIAMGKAMDHKMDEMLDTSKQLDQANQSGDKSHTSELSGKIQALSQEIGMLSNALSNSIKSVGEASSTLVRKG